LYLKTIKVAGFKSFADRTRLEFRPGVAVVVGPNGSGKSNLVDAVHWVLGTQAPKSLRTSKMEDVIFAGTTTRPALNRAEVTVVLDNGDRDLPLDLDEVAITRRLYRDGSSDYEINSVDCRLLDIQDLLNESGVGRHQHIIVNQGQVDSVLNAGPEEHRAIIEEAAGILKHRLRKERAIRRLERTDEDVIRLKDILSEIARQIRPLKRQAEAAGRHEMVSAQVRSLTLYLGGEDLRALDRRMAEARSEEATLQSRNVKEVAESDRLASELRRLTAEASGIGEALDRDGAAAARLETTLERLRRVAQVAQERHRTRRARLEGADERRRDLVQELSYLTSEHAEAESAETASGALAEQHEHRFRLLEDEERSLGDQENLSAEGALAVVQGDMRSLTAADQRDRRELEAVSQRVAVVNDHRSNEAEQAIRLGNEIRELDAEVTAAQTSYEKQAAARRRDQAVWEEAEAEHAEKRLEAAGANARLEAVAAAAEGMVDPQARTMVESSPGAIGTLNELLQVPSEWAVAVDAVLGPWSGSVAFADQSSLEDAVGNLKSSGLGGIPVVQQTTSAGAPAREVAGATGLDALIELIGQTSILAEILVGDVVVAEGWKAGLEVTRRFPHIRAVTPEGDLISMSGIKVANPDGATPLVVEAARADLETADRELARAASRQNSLHRQFEQSRQSERAALERLESVEAKLAGATEALGRSQRTGSELESELSRIEERRVALIAAISARAEQIARLAENIDALEGEEALRQRVIAEWTARRREAADAREQARAAWQEAASLASAATERRTLLDARRQVVEEEIGAEGGRPVSAQTLETLAAIESLARKAIEVLRGRIDLIRERQEESRQAARSIGQDLSSTRRLHEQHQIELDSVRNRLSALAIETTEVRVRREAVAEALRRESDASEDEALNATLVDLETDTNLLELLATRQAELRRMGPVNPLAAEEFRQLSDRHDFMSSQLADLETSRAALLKVMKALDDEIESEFRSAFDEVAAAYQDHFGVLFPGGKGRMGLSDPDQPLTSGVEIEAQPLGKKVAKLSLLSGGERSLAALAFLFAIFKARPSPFYILDEVEAALDDSNLRRFLRLVEAFKGESQIVLITHQQQTMEAADVLYGVTMEPGGSSQVIARQHSTASAAGR